MPWERGPCRHKSRRDLWTKLLWSVSIVSAAGSWRPHEYAVKSDGLCLGDDRSSPWLDGLSLRIAHNAKSVWS